MTNLVLALMPGVMSGLNKHSLGQQKKTYPILQQQIISQTQSVKTILYLLSDS